MKEDTVALFIFTEQQKKKTSKDKLQNKFNLSDKNDIKELSP